MSARGGCDEFWIVGRRDSDYLWLCHRILTAKRRKPGKGQLDSALASLLVLASDPEPTDVFLDPFAGSGATIHARLAYKYRQCFGVEIDSQEYEFLNSRFRSSERVTVFNGDFFSGEWFDEHSIDCIVTDPPWGEFRELERDFSDFIRGVAHNISRLLKYPGGRFVVLMARERQKETRKALDSCELTVTGEYSILVNGHPATVFVGRVVAH